MDVDGQRVPLIVSPDAQLKYLKPGRHFDRDLVDLAVRFVKADSCVWDVGANVGTFAFASAALATVGTVVAIEPDAWLGELLHRTRRLKEHKNRDVRIVPVAVAEENGYAELRIAQRGRATNALTSALGSTQMGGSREKRLVPTASLDSLLSSFPSPDFVKIDIEGAELMALRGASRLLAEVQPLVYCEVHTDNERDLRLLMAGFGYQPFEVAGNVPLGECLPNTLFRLRS